MDPIEDNEDLKRAKESLVLALSNVASAAQCLDVADPNIAGCVAVSGESWRELQSTLERWHVASDALLAAYDASHDAPGAPRDPWRSAHHLYWDLRSPNIPAAAKARALASGAWKRPQYAYYVPVEGHVRGKGFRVSVVFEGEDGHFPTGTWPYEGKADQKMPWFWGGDSYAAAEAQCRAENAKIGLSEQDAFKIVMSSMTAANKRRGRSKGNRR